MYHAIMFPCFQLSLCRHPRNCHLVSILLWAVTTVIIIMGICRGISTEWLFNHCFQIELEFGVLVFLEGGKPENPEKNPRNRDENQQKTQPTCDAGSRNRTRATAVGGERSHHCAIPAPLVMYSVCV